MELKAAGFKGEYLVRPQTAGVTTAEFNLNCGTATARRRV
jgi:hypothetical protein